MASKLRESLLNISTENLRSSDSCFFTKRKHHILPSLLKPALTQTRAACLFLSQQKAPCTASFFHGQERSVKRFNEMFDYTHGAHLAFKLQLCFNFQTAQCVCVKVNAAHLNEDSKTEVH